MNLAIQSWDPSADGNSANMGHQVSFRWKPLLSTESNTAQAAAESENDYQIITDRRLIVRLLEELEHGRALLTALLNSGKSAFSTALLGIEENKGSLILDEFIPEHGNAAMTPGDKIWVLGQLHGIKTAFQANVLNSGSENGIAFHRITIPTSVRHQQRRQSFRATVSLGIRSPVQIKSDDGHALNGQLRDLSIGGLSVILPLLREMGDLAPGTLLAQCDLDLPGEGRVSVQAEIRHLEHDPVQNNTKLGLAFHELMPQRQRQIQRSVTYLEREQLRKQVKKED